MNLFNRKPKIKYEIGQAVVECKSHGQALKAEEYLTILEKSTRHERKPFLHFTFCNSVGMPETSTTVNISKLIDLCGLTMTPLKWLMFLKLIFIIAIDILINATKH